MFGARKVLTYFLTKGELGRRLSEVDCLVVHTWSRFLLRLFATAQRQALATTHGELGASRVSLIWTVLQIVVTGARHAFLEILVNFVSLCVHVNLWTITDR